MVGRWKRYGTEYKFEGQVHGATADGLNLSSKNDNFYGITELADRGYAYLSSDGRRLNILTFKGTEATPITAKRLA
jgi:hypothetical protein